jgi:hypothetical protein
MNTGAKDPNRGIDILSIIGSLRRVRPVADWKPMPHTRDYGCEKWLGWLDGM